MLSVGIIVFSKKFGTNTSGIYKTLKIKFKRYRSKWDNISLVGVSINEDLDLHKSFCFTLPKECFPYSKR